MKLSSEKVWIFKRQWKFQASHTARLLMVGNSQGWDWNFQAGLKCSSENEVFTQYYCKHEKFKGPSENGVLKIWALGVEREARAAKCPHRRKHQKPLRLISQQTGVYPYPLGVGSARPNPKKGAPDTENPSFVGLTVLRGRLRPWSQKGADHGVGVDPSLLNFWRAFFLLISSGRIKHAPNRGYHFVSPSPPPFCLKGIGPLPVPENTPSTPLFCGKSSYFNRISCMNSLLSSTGKLGAKGDAKCQESAKGAGGKGARVINCHNFFFTPDRETRRIDHTTTEGTAERKMRQFATPAPFTPAPFWPFWKWWASIQCSLRFSQNFPFVSGISLKLQGGESWGTPKIRAGKKTKN